MDQQEPVMISALNHYLYCSRRCALVHVEQVWSENVYTMRGNDIHENVDTVSTHESSGIVCERAMPIWSRRLNLVGKADLVEFHGGIPYPVEYKSGRHKEFENNYIQLCAQAISLEEMLRVSVPKGAFYWHGSRERQEIIFTEAMRKHTEKVVIAVNDIIVNHQLPPPVNDKRCRNCSLKDSCLPQVVGEKDRLRKAVRDLFTSPQEH